MTNRSFVGRSRAGLLTNQRFVGKPAPCPLFIPIAVRRAGDRRDNESHARGLTPEGHGHPPEAHARGLAISVALAAAPARSAAARSAALAAAPACSAAARSAANVRSFSVALAAAAARSAAAAISFRHALAEACWVFFVRIACAFASSSLSDSFMVFFMRSAIVFWWES